MNNEQKNLKELLEKLREELTSQINSINEKQEKLGIEFSKILEKITITGEIPKSTIPAQELLKIFTESLNKIQQDIVDAPGTTKFSLGSFSPNVKATITFDEKGRLLLNLPQPGDPTPPEVLSNITFNVLPMPWEPSIKANEILVPNLVGLSFETAKSNLEEQGLVLGDVEKEQTDVESNIVLKQYPTAGLVVLKGSKINLTISEHIFVDVPLVVGLQLDDAKNVLENAGLGHKIQSEIESDQPVGQVLKQKPVAGEKVRRNTIVGIDISKGLPKQVPDLVGKTLNEAKLIISKSDLVFSEVIEKESDIKSGIIIHQDPPAGTLVAKKTKINLIVSKGLFVEVPTVISLQNNIAKKVIESIGLISEIRSHLESERPKGEVLNQEPSSGTRVTKNSKVMFDISKGGESKV